jgi:hypothetical protein
MFAHPDLKYFHRLCRYIFLDPVGVFAQMIYGQNYPIHFYGIFHVVWNIKYQGMFLNLPFIIIFLTEVFLKNSPSFFLKKEGDEKEGSRIFDRMTSSKTSTKKMIADGLQICNL